MKRALPLALVFAAACTTTAENPDPPPASAGSQKTASQPEQAPPVGKLPSGVRPTRYALDLVVDPDQDRFSGQVDIALHLDEAQTAIWLHGANLDVEEVRYTPAGQESLEGRYEQVTDHGLAQITFAKAAPAGEGALHLTWTAPFDRDLKGLYKVVHDDNAYAFTQMEPTSARYAFPSFDEPRFKVPFEVTVTAKEDHVVVGNTLKTKDEPAGEGLLQHHFAPTAPLPTYLLAWAVGPLDVVESEGLPKNAVRQEALPFRGIAAEGRGGELAYAMQETGKILAELEAYFGQPYPFDKLDIIAVPDFAAGAMENVGAVTFREVLLFLDEEGAPLMQKRAFANVMAHELAHMWFGNLVTMPWWDDIWLNEAFATWMATKISDRVYPGYEAKVRAVSSVQRAMGQDSLVAARQIRQPIESDHDIRNAFDSITYTKGGAVLAMFERWLTEPVVRDGIRRYMREHASGNATYEDLLAALSEASGKDVATPFKTFLFQPGVPLVKADLECGEAQNRLTITQERYLPPGSKGDRDKSWQIPVCARFGTGRQVEERCTLLVDKEGALDLGAECPAWVMPNADHAGYYRWTLPADDLARLRIPAPHERSRGRTQVAVPPRLSVVEWMSVADAIQTGFRTGQLKTGPTLTLLAPLAGHRHGQVVESTFGPVRFVHERLASEQTRPAVEAFVRQTYRPTLDRLGLEAQPDEPAADKSLRADLARTLIFVGGDEELEGELAELGRVSLGLSEGREPDPDLAPVAILAAVRTDPAAYEKAKELLATEQDPVRRYWLLGALPLVKSDEQAAQVRELVLDERLRTNEVSSILFGSFQLEEHRSEAWAFVKERFDELAERLPSHRAGSMPWVGTFFCSEEKAEEVEAFFRPRVEELLGGPRTLDKSVEAVRLCAARAALQRESAQAFFGGKDKSTRADASGSLD